uniref:Putative ovule protein n=1 Tax=Solanum chacoense TaxID=4108 RepID=A0A0V0GY50_SOLCH
MQRIISISLDYLNGIVQNLVSSYSTPIWATLVAGFFVVLTLALSMYLIFDHLSVYKHPEEQKFLIGVILMVPCYAVESVSFCFFFDFLKSCPGLYEVRLAESQNLSRNTKLKN